MAADKQASGFSVVPAGNWNNGFNNAGNNANFWSSTENELGSYYAYGSYLYYGYPNVNRNNNNKNNGRSVRCLRD